MKRRLSLFSIGLVSLFSVSCGVKSPESAPATTKPVVAVEQPEVVPEIAPLPAAKPLPFLKTQGREIVDECGQSVLLTGCNIGGWLLLEPWIPGLDSQEGLETEKEIWDLLGKRFGRDGKLELIKAYRDNFFTEDDVRRIADFGLNCIRIPIWWRATSDPEYGGDFSRLDRCIDWCKRYGIYAVLDLQGAPGGQAGESANVGEPADGGSLWKKTEYKQQTVDWWKQVALRYKNEPAVAMYDLLNEGTAVPKYDDLVNLYDQLYREIRKLDTNHIIVMEDIWGFHHLPLPETFGWENVAYSFHYYPRNMSVEQALEAPEVDLPRYNRSALYKGIPVYVGEFSSIDASHGGVNSFLKMRQACDHFGWSWTFWTWKKIEENDGILWGIYGYMAEKPVMDLWNDSLEKIRGDFEKLATSNTTAHPLLAAALRIPPRMRTESAAGKGALALSLREACLMPAEGGYLRYEWGYAPPSIGYWKAGDVAGWKVRVNRRGSFELGFQLANHSDSNRMQVWVDGVHVADAPIRSTAGWRNFEGKRICSLQLDAGEHAIQIGQADASKGFINLQEGWLKPVAMEAGLFADEKSLWLNPFNMAKLSASSPLRVEWLNDPPNVACWRAGQSVSWKLRLRNGGRYETKVYYATANNDSSMKITVDKKPVLGKSVISTGDWQKYRVMDLGEILLEAGDHEISLTWDVGHPTDAGNLRDIRMTKIPDISL